MLVLLASCDHNVTMLTDVHADGSIDKTIVVEVKDSAGSNMLGIGPATGWETKIEKLTAKNRKRESDMDYQVQLRKHFPTVAAANAELATPSDTLFRVSSTFEKKFRWFYTYLYYADTYQALNRMNYPIEDFVTPEDYHFIDRLAAEGKPIARADSLYLETLNYKLFNIYWMHAYFEEYYAAMRELIRKNRIGDQWLDSLRVHKQELLEKLMDDNNREMELAFVLRVVNSRLGIPWPAGAHEQLEILMKPAERMSKFMSDAHAGKYQHAVNMPWDVIETNADSVAGRSLFWSPPPMRFLIKDYTLYAEARQMNYWAVALSVAVIGFSLYLFWRRRN